MGLFFPSQAIRGFKKDEGQVEKEEDEEVEAQKAKDEGQIKVGRSSLVHLNIFEAEACIAPKSTTTTTSSLGFIEVASLFSVQGSSLASSETLAEFGAFQVGHILPFWPCH